MAAPLLVIGNKRTSSWSLRAWIGLKTLGVEFREHRIPLDRPGSDAEIRAFSQAGRVPILVDGDLTVFDSMAILEFASEAYGGGRLLPGDARQRARVRSVAAEMHAGFAGLREALPMDLQRPPAAVALDDGAARDIGRILSLWEMLREAQPGRGPYLFGAWSLADCFHVPVAARFHHYGVDTAAFPRGGAYARTLYELPALQEWLAAARKETDPAPWDTEKA